MTKEPELLPLEYEVHELSEGISAIVYDKRGMCVADHLSEQEASFLVAACNAYPKLLARIEALEGALEMMLAGDVDVSGTALIYENLARVTAHARALINRPSQ